MSEPDAKPAGVSCFGLLAYFIGALVLGLIASVVVGLFAVSGTRDGDDLTRNLRVNIGGTVLLAIVVVAFVVAFRAWRSQPEGRRLSGWRAFVFYGWPGFALSIAVPTLVGWSSYATETQDVAASGSQVVSLTGQLSGDTYRIASQATLTTSAEYKEASMEVHVSRIDNGFNSRTPSITIRIGDYECSTGRNYIWSTDEGSDVQLLCPYFVDLETLRTMTSGTVVND